MWWGESNYSRCRFEVPDNTNHTERYANCGDLVEKLVRIQFSFLTQNNFRSSRPFYVLRLPNIPIKFGRQQHRQQLPPNQFAICRSEVVPEAVAAPVRTHSEVEAEEAAALGLVVVRNSAQVIAQLEQQLTSIRRSRWFL